jgi:type IV secretion system protein VirD4
MLSTVRDSPGSLESRKAIRADVRREVSDSPSYNLPKKVGASSSPSSAAPLIAGALFVATGSAIVTQTMAAALGYNPALGAPLWQHFYPPYDFALWSFQFSPLSHTEWPRGVTRIAFYALRHGLWLGALGGALTGFFGAFLSGFSRKAPDAVKDLSDSSGEWATEADVKAAGLFAESGPIIGAFPTAAGDRTMRYDGPSGISVTAPPEAGKTAGYLVPNLTCLLGHPEASKWTDAERMAHPWGPEPSHFVLDVRGFLNKSTSGWRRAMGHNVFVVEPFSTDTSRAKINPLWAIEVGGIRMYDHCYQGALDAVDADGKPLPSYWDQACTAFLAAVIGSLGFAALYSNQPKLLSYPAVIDYICDFDDIEQLIEHMLGTIHDPHGVFAEAERTGADPDGALEFAAGQCAWIMSCTRAMAAKEKEERSGVFGTLAEKLNVFRSGVIRQHIMESTFTFRELANGDVPGCVYLSVPGMKLDHIRTLTRALVSHALRELTEHGCGNQDGREVRANKRTVCLWLDEVAALKTIPALASSSGFLRGYGVFLALFWQSAAQLRTWYGHDETLSENLKIRAFQAPNTWKQAKEWSEELGSFSVVVEKTSKSQRSKGGSDTSDSHEIHSRPLLTPGEVMRFGTDETGILMRGLKIRAKTFLYFKHPELARRARIAPVTKSDCIVTQPYFVERLERVIGEDAVATLLSPPPALPPAPQVAPPRSMLEEHLLNERPAYAN